MQRTTLIAGLALALAMPLTAAAADLSWDYVDLRYSDAESGGVTLDGYGIAGSKSLSDRYYVFGAYDDTSGTFGPFDVGFTSWRVGMGGHRPINDKIEGYSDISFESIDASIGATSASDTGYGFRFGLRGNVSDSFELSGGIRFLDVGSSDTLLGIGGVWRFSDKFGVVASYEDGDTTYWSVGGRFMF